MNSGKRVLVTGAAGFIGSHMVEELVGQQYEVVGVDCFTDYYSPETKRQNIIGLQAIDNFELFTLDLLTDPIEPVLEGVETIFHLAAQPGVRSSWASGFKNYVERNILVTQRLLDACRAFPSIRLVNASSSSVYGNATQYPTSETQPTTPLSPYGVTKLAAEALCSVYGVNFGVRTVSLRYFSVYGPRQRPDMATYRMIEAARRSLPFSVYGSGHQVRDFTFVADVVEANLAAAAANVEPGSIYNIGGGSASTVLEMADLVSKLTGKRLHVDIYPAVEGDTHRTSADTTRANADLGWFPRTEIEIGVKAQVAWQLA
jgi:nucleoside-diphosphate-sugar epimerase